MDILNARLADIKRRQDEMSAILKEAGTSPCTFVQSLRDNQEKLTTLLNEVKTEKQTI